MKAPYPDQGSPHRAGRRRSRNAAFTLVEVMMATMVMLFGISSSILVMQSGFKALDTARKTTLAAQIMQSEMERIRLLGWSDVAAMPESGTVDFSEIFPRATEEQRKIYDAIAKTFEATFTTKDLSANDNEVRQIDVTVTWTGLDGAPRSRSSFTQYSKTGLYAYYYTRARS